eukprot:gene7865-biopygen18077
MRGRRGSSPPGVWAGPYSWGPNPRHVPQQRRLQAYGYRGRFGVPPNPLRARATDNGPALQVSGTYCWGPNPRHMGGPGVRRLQACGRRGRCAVPHTPTSPLYRRMGVAGRFLPPLRARSTGPGPHSWGPNPRHIGGRASPPGVG